MVVGVGIDAQSHPLLFAESKAGPANASRLTVGGQAVDGDIRVIVRPCPVVDDLVCGVLAGNGAEGAHDLALFLHHIAYTPGDLLCHQLRPGITGAPLVGVAGTGHKGFGCLEQFQQSGQVPGLGGADGHDKKLLLAYLPESP